MTVSTASVPIIDEAAAAAYAAQQRAHDEAYRRAHGGADRPPLSRTRVYAALLALALGGFGIGSTEFVAMGLLPDIARDLLPGLYASNAEEAIGQSGWVITAYALGVVVGAPIIAAFGGRMPRRRLLLWLAAGFTVGTIASATLPTFELVIAARFLAGLPHGAYFGVAALVAASMMGPGKRGQGVALVLSGLTVATVIGVPVITAYALGVVVGAPIIAALGGRMPRRRLLLWLAAGFTVGTIASATLPTFELVIAARFLAGLPHGAYFGVAALVAASMMGPGKRGQGVALVLSGLTVATVIGVPVITAVGQAAGWRAAYLVVATLFAATFVAVRILVPWQPGDANSTVRRELAAFGSLQVWVAVAVGAIGFGGFFAVYSYIAPMVTDAAGMPSATVPWVLAGMGIGLTIGNIIGGRLADAGTARAMFIGFIGLIGSMVVVGLAGQYPVGLVAGTFLVGFMASIISPVIQTRLMDVAGDSQTLAAALNHSALNVGNALGAFLGGLVVAAGWGFLTPAWVGLLLALGGLLLAVVSVALERRSARAAGSARAESVRAESVRAESV